MGARKKLPSDQQLKKWLDAGYSHEEIRTEAVEISGEEISLSSISSACSRAGLTYRVRYEKHIPWRRISVDHNSAYQLTMLRIASRLERGLDVRKINVQRFENWKQQLEEDGVVVHYEYNSPAGFYYVKARQGIDNDLIRELDQVDKEEPGLL